MQRGICSFMNVTTKACCICNVRERCPRKCNGINGKEREECRFFKGSEIYETICPHESNVRNGLPLDEDSMFQKLNKGFGKIKILLEKEEKATDEPIAKIIEVEKPTIED